MIIDWWTLGIQTVNVFILVLLLGRFFWHPLAGMIEQRRANVQSILAEAEAKRTEAIAASAEIERTRAGFAQERAAILAAAEQAADLARIGRLDEVTKEAAAMEVSVKARIAKENEVAQLAWADRANHLAVDIAQHLASRLDGPTVQSVFLDWLMRAIHNLPEAARQSVTANDLALEVVSAVPLNPGDEARCRKLIAEAFGANPKIAFTVDPALIAGLELRGPNLIITNSWRADLTQILADLAHDKRI